jgi:DNA-binding transcriptional LysR family regulator
MFRITMRKFKIPNMGALLAFEAAARHESFTHAAKELFLTESAISRQIATLESSLGVRLFVRARQRVMLTRAGRIYGTQVRRSLEQLDRDTLSIIAHGSGGGYLELAVLPTFASQWLIPRIKHFYDCTPDVRVNMGVRTETFSFADSHFEAAIHYGKPTWPGTAADYLFGEEVVPVCKASLLDQPIRKAAGPNGSRTSVSKTPARCMACATNCTPWQSTRPQRGWASRWCRSSS